ncbi:TetR/AcrR family transcriptional regulator [Pseudonocardia endophytica]|uniref:TetR family transcriptional regulator n=1 Tax=Pseudonocardia endophytica TaxID=401976 RepID=A0A4R1HXN0_PSEEN|nr:TetR/AcrR family transcriptional regulator [Pseudonocardia endophytica]TCK25590.1 TetR family transcriptional regulator [Pseudonocardia endophytica]
MSTSPARKRVGRAEREQQILDAAVDVFSSRGYAGASMDTVAERVGVTKPVLYTHFGSKEGLLLACIGRARAELLDATATAAAAATTPEDMLRRGTRAFFDYLDARAPAWTLLYSEAGVAAQALEEVRTQQTDFIASLLGAQAPDTDPARLTGWAQVIVGACERLAVWRGQLDPARRVSAEQATEFLMDLVWTGLARDPS